MFDNRELIPQYRQVLGDIPAEWVRDALADGMLDHEPDDSLFPPPEYGVVYASH